MPEEPQISVLSYRKRVVVFWSCFLIFIMAMPALIFYTSGNRLVFDDEETTIVSMGGIYLGNDLDDIDVYIDESPIDKSRLFRRALYLEDITSGQHRVHVQAPGLQTWVKELSIFPGIVTESFSFNLPTEAQVRLITPYQTATGTSLLSVASTSALVFQHASVTNQFATSTSQLARIGVENPEHTFVADLFRATSTIDSTLLERVQDRLEAPFTFSSATPTTTAATSSATTTVISRDLRFAESGTELVLQWRGVQNEAPYYFCVTYGASSTLDILYGTHVAEDVFAELASSTETLTDNDQYCRTSIKLDRLQQDVKFFNFLPGSSDLVLLHLEDGLYVTEIDDRAWQNTQLLYPGTEFKVILDGGQIYIAEDGLYFEVFTTLDTE